MITRQEAIETLQYLVNAGILSEEIENNLGDIINCIKAERDIEIHAWGMPDDEWTLLHTAKRTDLPEFKDFIKKQKSIIPEYRFTPSKNESV